MTYAVTTFIEEKLHPKYVENRAVPFEESYTESGPATPVFFILSPGVDPLKDVERVGKKLGFTFDNKVCYNNICHWPTNENRAFFGNVIFRIFIMCHLVKVKKSSQNKL